MKKNISVTIGIAFSLFVSSCFKGKQPATPISEPATPISEPAIVSTQGFFLDNWQPKTWTDPASPQQATKPSASGAVTVTVDPTAIVTKTSNYIFGNNANPYEGQMVTASALISQITNLAPHIIRFPGGVANTYFWNQPTGGPTDAPAMLLDSLGVATTARYYPGTSSANSTISIDNFYSALKQTNSTAIITINYGYARYGTGPHPVQTAAHLAADWVRYDKGRTTYWELGNECYEKGEAGYRINTITNQDGQPQKQDGTTYGTQFKIFADSMRAAAKEVGNTTIKIGLSLTITNDVGVNTEVSNWNHNILTAEGNSADFFVVHNYYTKYHTNAAPPEILATPAPQTSAMMAWIASSVKGAGAIQKPVAMDEWNIFSTGSNQMVSNIAGLHATLVLGEVLKNQLSLACRWNTCATWSNGDDLGMFNNVALGVNYEEPGAPDWNPRPAFYYMYYFQQYFGDHLVASTSSNTDIVSYGSSFSSGQTSVILINTSNTDHVVSVSVKNFTPGASYYYHTLNGGTDNPPFSHKVYVDGNGPTTGVSGGPSAYLTLPAQAASQSGGITVTVPAYGAVFLVADGKY